MGTVTVLDADAVGDALPPDRVLAAVRTAFAALGAGRAVQPPQVVLPLSTGGDAIVYPAAIEDAGLFGVKISPYLPQPAGPAVVTAWTLLVSAETGAPVLLCDAGALTAQRTAATSALAVDLLAPADAATLAIIGAGPLARAHLAYARAVRPFADVRVFSRSGAGLGEGVAAAPSADAAAEGADVVLLCTSAAAPVLDVARLAPGTVVTSISTNAPRAHEIDPAALGTLDVYCDHAPSAVRAAGELLLAIEAGSWSADAIRGDLAGLVAGAAQAPSGDRPVFFRSIGLGIEDIAIAGLLA
jgi:L-arginine dehydrogenase